MVRPIHIAAMLGVVWFTASVCTAQDSADDLKRRVEQLEDRVQLLEKSLNLLLSEREKTPLQNSMAQTPSLPANNQPGKATENPADPFRVGVTWVGEAKSGNRTAKWAISISERDGQRFAGGMVMVAPNGEKVEMPISGTAPDSNSGLVVMETALVGRAKYFARGRLQNGEIALTFKGTSNLGQDMVGASTLRPKN